IMLACNVGAILFVLVQDPAEIGFYGMMDRYCEQKGDVVALNLAGDKTYYSWPQYVIEPRVIETRFYMPSGFANLHFDTFEALEAAARALAAERRHVIILSADPDLAGKSALRLRKIAWNPYPEWVVRHCNFNDWTRYSLRSKNIYEVLPAEEVAQQGRS
ncbi:MAG: hypothetical protein K2O55_04600, partial [Alistipes sp.]|nr:hypothetical protein [Alistipes sp.]